MKRILRGLAGGICFISAVFAFGISAKASTGIYVGKEINPYETTIISVNSECSPGYLSNLKTISGVDEDYRYILYGAMSCENQNSDVYFSMNENGLFVALGTSVKMQEESTKDYKSSNVDTEDKESVSGKGVMTAEQIARYLAAENKTARAAVRELANKVEEDGSDYFGALMIGDTQETWYVEIYSANQLAAVMCDEDKVIVFGDDFLIDENLINEAKKTITTSDISDIQKEASRDLFIDSEKEVRLYDIISIYRKKENVLPDYFYDLIDENVNSVSYAVTVYDDMPAQMSEVLWLCNGDARYTPFAPVSNAVTDICDGYSDDLKRSTYASGIAACEYARLSDLCNKSNGAASPKVREAVSQIEKIYISEVDSLIRTKWLDEYEESQDEGVKCIDEYCRDAMQNEIECIKNLYDDVSWLSVKSAGNISESYDSYIDIEEYARQMGYEVTVDGSTFTAVKEDRTVSIELTDMDPSEVIESLEVEYFEEEEAKAGINVIERNSRDVKSDKEESDKEESDKGESDKEDSDKENTAANGMIHELILEEIDKIPEVGWSREEALEHLNKIKSSVKKLVEKYPDNLDDAETEEILEEIKEESSGLVDRYFDISIEEILGDAASGNLSKEDITEILNGIDADIDGLMLAYFRSKFDGLVDDDLSDEEILALLDEASNAAISAFEAYSGINLEDINVASGLDEITVDDVASVIESLDSDTRNELGELLGVDVDSVLKTYREGNLQVEVDIDVNLDEAIENTEVKEVVYDYLGYSSMEEKSSEVVTEEQINETVAEEPVEEEPVVEPVSETISEEPVEEGPVVEPASETIAEEPSNEVVVEEPVCESIAEEPVNIESVEEAVNEVTVEMAAGQQEEILVDVTEELSSEINEEEAASAILVVSEQNRENVRMDVPVYRSGGKIMMPSWARILFK